MTYALDFSLNIGTSGLTDLRAQLVDTGGVDLGSSISTGFSDLGGGFYLWHYGLFLETFTGAVKFYRSAFPTVILAVSAVEPQASGAAAVASVVATRPVFDVLLHAARALDVVTEGAATGNGSATTLIDSHLAAVWAGTEDNEFNQGALFWKTHGDNIVTGENLGDWHAPAPYTAALLHAPVVEGSLQIVIGPFAEGTCSIADDGAGHLVCSTVGFISGTIDYVTGAIAFQFSIFPSGTVILGVTASYYAGNSVFLPVVLPITDFDAATGTVSFEAALAGWLASTGDAYAIVSRRYPVWLMLQKMNEVLSEIDDCVSTQYHDRADIVNGEIALADSLRITGIWQGNAAGDRRWSPVTRYRRAGGVLHLDQSIVGDTLMIESTGPVANVISTAGAVPEQFSKEWLGLATAVKCCRWRLMQAGADDRLLATQLADLQSRERAALWNRSYRPTQPAFAVDGWALDKWDAHEQVWWSA